MIVFVNVIDNFMVSESNDHDSDSEIIMGYTLVNIFVNNINSLQCYYKFFNCRFIIEIFVSFI